MPLKDRPAEGDLVVATIQDVNPNSVYLSLDEYPDLEGMVNIAEVARSWLKDIHKHVSEGEKTVAQVLEAGKDPLMCSLKRVNDKQKRDKMAAWKKEQKARRFFEEVAEKLEMDPETIVQDVGKVFQEEFGHMFDGFEQSLVHEERVKELLDEDVFAAVKAVAEDHISLKRVTMESEMEIQIPVSNGIQSIKEALSLDDENVQITYLGAPHYRIETWGVNRDMCKQTMDQAIKTIRGAVEASDGTFAVERK